MEHVRHEVEEEGVDEPDPGLGPREPTSRSGLLGSLKKETSAGVMESSS